MEYFVVAKDGQEYGPATVSTLREWALDNRVAPTTQLRDVSSGQIVFASAVEGLFGDFSTPPVQTPGFVSSPYVSQPTQGVSKDSMRPLWGSLFRAGIALVLFFFLHGIGLFVGGFALYDAVQAKASGNRYGWACIGVTAGACALIGMGWILGWNG